MITAKCSMHHGSKYNLKHNRRDYDTSKWNRDGHINPERSNLNVTLVDKDLREFFDETFGEALTAYNKKNEKKHPERVISMDDYFKEHKHQAMEFILQLGDHKNYWEVVDSFREKVTPKEVERMGMSAEEIAIKKADDFYTRYLTLAFEKWQEDNPSWKVFNAHIHLDEVGKRGKDKGGTPHLHIDTLPVSEQEKGLTVKVNKDGALAALGYKRKTAKKDGENDKYSETPFKKWTATIRKGYEQFAQLFCRQEKQDIFILSAEESHTTHVEPQVYRAEKAKQRTAAEKVKDFLSGDKKNRDAAAEYIIENANAVKGAITSETEEKMSELREKFNYVNTVAEHNDEIRKHNESVHQKKEAELNERDISVTKREKAVTVREQYADSYVAQKVSRELAREEIHREMTRTSEAYQERMRRIGVSIDDNGLAVSKGR